MKSNLEFKKLLEPITIKGMKIRNRFVMAPMLGGSDEAGFATEQMKNYYGRSAQGGVGLIVLGAHCIDSALGRIMPIQPNLDDDKYIPALREVSGAIQKQGARAVMQILHGGPVVPSKLSGTQPLGASAIERPDGEPPREITLDEIAHVIQLHADAAIRARKAGFDAVEIHAANRYLINSFLSPAWNIRQDAYGGSIENRTRFLVETIKAVRAAVGEDYPLFCRINGMEYGVKNGITPDQAQQIAKIAQDAGLDVIDVSAVNPHTSASPSFYWPEGAFIHLAGEVKKAVDIPVVIAGRNNPELGEKALMEKKADMIAMARALVADPDLPTKVAEGKLDDIIPCQSCNCCRGGTRDYPGAVCAINPMAQRQWEFEFTAAKNPKKVLVVGGGPAGMEAAKDAALRGHRVTLYDKREKLGGQLIGASIPPSKQKIWELVTYLAGQLEKTGVQVNLGVEVTEALVREIDPDVVVLATGAVSLIPNVPGINGDNVVTAIETLCDCPEVGEKVVVVGGGLIGCETADHLAVQGKKVTVVEMLDQIGADVGPNIGDVLERMEKAGVESLVKTKMEEITPDGVKATKDGTPVFLEADTVVIAVGLKSNNMLAEKLKEIVPEVYVVGYCLQPRRILEAIHDGFNAAWKI